MLLTISGRVERGLARNKLFERQRNTVKSLFFMNVKIVNIHQVHPLFRSLKNFLTVPISDPPYRSDSSVYLFLVEPLLLESTP